MDGGPPRSDESDINSFVGGVKELASRKRTGGSRQTLAAVACGGGGGAAGGSNKGTIVIASDHPASGGEASTGIPELQAVAFVPGHRHPGARM